MSYIDFFDPNFPRYGEAVNSESIRSQFNNLATDNSGDTVPSIPATLIGDKLFGTANLSTASSLDLEIDGTRLTVDCTSQATVAGSATIQEVVDSINDAFVTNGGFVSPVAFVFNKNTDENNGFILLRSPTSGSNSFITLRSISGSTDAEPLILAVSGRDVNFPYTVTGVDLPKGYKWYRTSELEDEEQRIYIGSPGFVIGNVNIPISGFSVVNRRNLRIRIDCDSGSFGPLDIDISGASINSTTGAEIVDNINAAFVAEPGWPSATGPASLVSRNGSGSYLKIVSGPADDPSTGTNAKVVLSEPVAGSYLADDGILRILGLPLGKGDERYSLLPHTFTGANFSNRHIRGLNNRRGAGIGMWGVPLERIEDIPAQGVVDGEVRFDAAEGIGWIFKKGATAEETGWHRIIPGFEYPVSYDTDKESYKIRTTTEGYLPEPLTRQTYPTNEFISQGDLTGMISQIPSLIDSRNHRFPNVDYPEKPWESSGSRNLHLPKAKFDDFNAGGSGGQSISQIRTGDGSSWQENSATADNESLSIPGTGLGIGIVGGGTEELRAFNKNAPGYVVPCLTAVNGVNTVFTANLRDLANITDGAVVPIVPGSVRVYLGTYQANSGPSVYDPLIIDETTNGAGLEAYDIRDNAAGGFISGLLTGTNTIDYSTGALTVEFSSPPPSGSNRVLLISFSLSSDIFVVAAEILKQSPRELGWYAGVSYKGVGTIAINNDTGYFVKIFDTGVGTLSKRTNTGSETVLTTFNVDPNFTNERRTLRVISFRNGSSRIHQVYWNGSSKSTDWFNKENVEQLPDLLTDSDTAGGKEIRRNKNFLVATYIEATEEPELVNGSVCGIVGFGSAVFIDNWQAHGGWEQSPLSAKPGLPPVSGARVRDTINAVKVSGANGIFQGGVEGIITDCDPAFPLQIEPQDPLFVTQDTANRKLVFGSNFGVTDHASTSHDAVVGMVSGYVNVIDRASNGVTPNILSPSPGFDAEITFNNSTNIRQDTSDDLNFSNNFQYIATVTPIQQNTYNPGANTTLVITSNPPGNELYWSVSPPSVDNNGGKVRVTFNVNSNGIVFPTYFRVTVFYVRTS